MSQPARSNTYNRSVRSLVDLEENASTARTLNLVSAWQRHGRTEPYKENPFFHSPTLNRSIIVKHRLRSHERDDFYDGRSSATKVILPINLTDLRSGARSFFVGQNGYDDLLAQLAPSGNVPDPRDDHLLRMLDTLPSLDPFLMRERLRKGGVRPARCYFDLTEADASRMFAFVKQEVMPLVAMTFDIMGDGMNDKIARLANKLLANAGDVALEPLRRSMGMERLEFEEGVFCWKGFIYYKWTLAELLPKVRPTALEISAVTPAGQVTYDEKAYIVGARVRLARTIMRFCESVVVTLKAYDEAYADLTDNGKPQTFRNFLLEAPALFYDLGERLGAVQHIISFWRFRFPKGGPKMMGDELVALLSDFEASLDLKLACGA